MLCEKCNKDTFVIHINSRHEKVCSDCYYLNQNYPYCFDHYYGAIFPTIFSPKEK